MQANAYENKYLNNMQQSVFFFVLGSLNGKLLSNCMLIALIAITITDTSITVTIITCNCTVSFSITNSVTITQIIRN